MTEQNKTRIESIDVLRGMAMVLMALDHVRDYFHLTANTDDPLNIATTTPALFFTRWITHFCAPVFIFLSGTSIYLQHLRKPTRALSVFLIKRGLWLIFAEVVIVSLGWSFNPNYQFHFLQVIWTIGISMVILGLVIHLPFKVVLALGLVIVFGHNLLDIPESAPGFHAGFWWDLLHHGNFALYPYAENHALIIIYPFLPWTGLMMLGYCAGIFYSKAYTASQRRTMLLRTGVAALVFFVALRATNLYGDPVDWSVQQNGLLTLFSFLTVQKYPASLLFMCVTIGPALLLLALLEKVRNGFTGVMNTFGRVAFFYYILHLYLIHLLETAAFFSRGHTLREATVTGGHFPFYFVAPGEGYGLGVVYMVWLLVIAILYPLCRWYDRYKTAHKEQWWLSYL